jgi:hypothetical protein
MSLHERLVKKCFPSVATATPATTATHEEVTGPTASTVATVAVATAQKQKPDKRLNDRDRWLFVCFTPFTRTDIEAGAADGTGPLDSHDLEDIEAGHYLTERRQQYLRGVLNNLALANKGDR